jgi:hypothetical protein
MASAPVSSRLFSGFGYFYYISFPTKAVLGSNHRDLADVSGARRTGSARDMLYQRDNPASSASHALISRIAKSDRCFNLMPCSVQVFLKTTSIGQRLPTRLTGPPRFIGVPALTPGAATARATGRGRSTTPGLTTHPAGYATYWQYTTAPAGSLLVTTNPAISSADKEIESFIFASSVRKLQMFPR